MNSNSILHSCEEANNLDMVDYFSRLGLEPKESAVISIGICLPSAMNGPLRLKSTAISTAGTTSAKEKAALWLTSGFVISSLSSGEFVGITADNPSEEISLKAFHCKVINNHKLLSKEEAAYQLIPVFKQVTQSHVQRNFEAIKEDIKNLVELEMEKLLNDPALANLIVQK